MIKSFTCSDFRNVLCSELPFERINILIGPNNAGKSNFIRALSFAANMVGTSQTDVTGFLSELKRNGWNQAVDRREKKESFRLAWHFELGEEYPVVYTLCANVGEKRGDNYIVEESLDAARIRSGSQKPYNYFCCHRKEQGKGEFSTAGMDQVRNNRLIVNVDRNETVLLQMDKLFFDNKEMFSTPFVRDRIRKVLESMRLYFRSFYSYSCTAFHIAAIRELQDEQADGSYLKKDGSNFVNVYAVLEETYPKFKETYIHMLKKQMSDCEDIRISKAGGKIWMELKVRDCYYSLSELSDGTVHLLVLLLLLSMPEQNGISMLAVDEPEMNLHPAWQKVLANEILRGQSFKQCFISTHSPEFLDEFTDEFLSGDVGVFVFDPLSRTPILKLNREELRSELTGWTLGDLYRIGDPMIGGWPQ